MTILPCKAPIKGGPLPSISLAPANCKGSSTIVNILPLQEGGIYSEQLFTFDQGTGYNSFLPWVIELIHNGVGSSMCLACEIMSAFVLHLPAWCVTIQLNC